MADLLSGIVLVEGLSRFMPALLVLLLLFAILEYTHALGKNTFVNVFIALCASVLVLISPQVSGMLSFMTPWFMVLFFFIIFVLIGFKSMGVSDAQIMSVMSEYRGISWILIFIAIVIVAVGLGNVFGQDLLEEQPGYSQNLDGTYTTPEGEVINDLPPGAIPKSDYQSNLTKTLFHPTILGFALIGLIATFTVLFMTRS